MALIVIGISLFGNINGNAVKNDSDTIKIGFAGILSGEASIYGQSSLAGATLAIKEVNDQGGINGKKVELITEDDKISSVDSVNSYTKLINIDKVVAIISGDASGPAASATPIAQSNGVPVIISAASAPKITQTGNYIFRTMPSDSFQGKYAAEYIYNKIGKKKLALIYVNNDWGVGIKDVFEKRYKELGGNIVYKNSFGENEKDFKTQFLQVEHTDAEIIYFLAYPDNALAGFKQIKEMNLNIPVMGADAIDGDSAILQSEYSEGIKYTVSKINSPKEFVAKINTLKGFENLKPNIAAATTYDGTKILLDAIEKVGTDRSKIRDEIAQIKYYGISNPVIEFDNNREIKDASAEVKIIKNGGSVSITD